MRWDTAAAAATARAEKAEAGLAGLQRRDAIQTEAIRAAKGLADCYRQLAEAAEVPQDGLSAMEENAGGSQASVGSPNSSASPEGPQEPEPPRDPTTWCWAPNPAGRLHCGRLRNHEPPHQRGERTWGDDDTTEGR